LKKYYEVKSKKSSTLAELIANLFSMKQNEQQRNLKDLKKRQE